MGVSFISHIKNLKVGFPSLTIFFFRIVYFYVSKCLACMYVNALSACGASGGNIPRTEVTDHCELMGAEIRPLLL